MQAIILVGGFGTRLRALFPDLPKPMAPINGRPFLAYLLDSLQKQGITSVIFPVHYLREKIQDFFQDHYAGIKISYIEEPEPLGTGGAIVNALSLVQSSEPVFVLNGDTFVKLNYRKMFHQHAQTQSDLTLALRSVADCSRYGKVMTDDGYIIEFREKGEIGAGLINAGVYLINPGLFKQYNLGTQFSFEKEFLFPYLGQIKPQSFITDDYFIDIGVPEDYARANRELPLIS